MKYVKYAVCSILIILIATATSLSVENENIEQRNQYDCTIGIIFYGYPEMDNFLSKNIFQYGEYLENHFNVKIEFASTLQMSQKEATKKLCNFGADIIINAVTQTIPESIAICEEYQVYWLQVFDMPIDTDVVDSFYNNKYFVGYILSNDINASELIAEQMLSQGMNRIGVVSYPESMTTSNIHTVRINAIQNAISKDGSSSIDFLLRTYDIKSGLISLATQEYKPDGLIITNQNHGYTAEEMKELFDNPQLKLAYFDIVSTTRDDFSKNDAIIVSCGQHNIIGLAFAYAYHYVTSEYRSEQKLELYSDYITLTNVDEYDKYIKYCVDSMPYSAEELNDIISNLNSDKSLIIEYANNYSLNEVLQRR